MANLLNQSIDELFLKHEDKIKELKGSTKEKKESP